MKPMIAGILLVLTAGCALQPHQVVGREYLERRAQAATAARECMDAVKNGNPVYERLNSLFIFDLQDDRQLSKIANNGYVSEQTVADMVRLRELVQPCHDRMLADYGQVDRRYAAYLLGVRAQSDANLLALLNRELSIGERNLFVLETLLNNRSKFAEIDREILAEIRRDHYFGSQKESGGLEESFAVPAISLPRQVTPPEAAAALPGSGGRCRFEGTAIRCDRGGGI